MDVNEGITKDRTNIDLINAITDARTNLNSKIEQHELSHLTIYRVHRHVRDINYIVYEPEVISIGPYHRGKDHLKRMEDHKLHILKLIVERKGIEVMEHMAKAVGEVASKARKCYADQDFWLSDIEFIEMLVLDGCFIIELVLTYIAWGKEVDPFFKMGWMYNSLKRDLMLFENQVPFFVLRKLFNLIWREYQYSHLVYLLSYFFNDLYPGSELLAQEELESRSSEVAKQGSEEIMHILDLIHRIWLPRESQKSYANAITIKGEGHESQESKEEKSDTHTKGKKDFKFICSATTLTEANVKFKIEAEATCLFDIKFIDGTMLMPPLCINIITECLFWNLIAYEQYFKDSPHNFVTQYMRLLDILINSAKDVEILSQNGIIKNLQGDDEVVANMVNRLGDLIAYGPKSIFKYFEVTYKVNEHCMKPKNRWIPKNKWMAMLRRDYLNSPWAVISILAAVVLLLLTVVQTVFTILQVVQNN